VKLRPLVILVAFFMAKNFIDRRWFDIAIILLSFRESVVLGLIMIGYVFYITINRKNLEQGMSEALRVIDEKWKQKHKIVKDQLDAIFEERNSKIITEQEFARPQETPQKIVQYGNWIIEDYGGYYVILDSDLKPHPKMFHSIEDCHRTIDALALNVEDIKNGQWKEI